MKNLLNCHTVGVHSFPISFEQGWYKRIFYADTNHALWQPTEVAIHPHHVNIKITVLEGALDNLLYEINEVGTPLKKYRWNSHILNGNGGFEYLGEEKLQLLSKTTYSQGHSFEMEACEMHTIEIKKGAVCVWLIEESAPTCEYFPINYSPHDLSTWRPDGLYIEVDDAVKQQYVGKYLKAIGTAEFDELV